MLKATVRYRILGKKRNSEGLIMKKKEFVGWVGKNQQLKWDHTDQFSNGMPDPCIDFPRVFKKRGPKGAWESDWPPQKVKITVEYL